MVQILVFVVRLLLRLQTLQWRKGLVIYLAVGGQWHFLQHHHCLRDHVAGHLGLQEILQLRGQRCGVAGRSCRGNNVTHNLLLSATVLGHHRDTLFHCGIRTQLRIDLAKLNAEAPDLNLVVCPSDTLDLPAREVMPQISRAVPSVPCHIGLEGIGDELRGSVGRQPNVALGQMRAADIDLSCFPKPCLHPGLVEEDQADILHPTPTGDDLLEPGQLHRVSGYLKVPHGALRLGGAKHVHHPDIRCQLVQQQHVPFDEDVPHEEAALQRRDCEVRVLDSD
mmetsp:Transcript_80486/g.134664  ORF Transcript_80486/g.134664 Transcript_80486/m.134664 type:complete len:280 (+) Transcript_80486:2158-2997(+)